MSLRVWLPLTKDLRQQGLDNVTVTNNGATFNSAGKLGGCYSFNGSSYITVQDVVLQNIWSYSCWLYSDVSSRSWEVVMACNINGGDADMQLGLYTRPGGNNIQNTANGQYNASIPMTYGQWNHFVGTFDGANLKTYLNGVLVNTKAITNAKLDRPKLTIGARCRGSSYDCYFQGLLNDIRIYDHCLSPMEVKELAKGLVLHYPLNRQGWGQENLFKVNCCSGGKRATFLENGRRVKINWVSNDGDTYWYLGLASGITLTEGKTYTLSFQCSGLGNNTVIFRWCNLINYSMSLKNGFNIYTFSMPSTSITNPFFDDATRDTNLSDLELWNFKLEEGSIATPWCPNSSDALATTIGLNSTTEYDCSGFCNNGTRTGTFTWTSDTPKYNISTYMPKAALITHPRPVFGGTDQEWTCAMWVKLDDLSSSQMLNNFNRGNYLTTGTNALLYLNDGTNDYYNYANTKLTAGVWTHVVFVFKNTNVIKRIYFNGVDKTNTSGPNKTSTPAGIPDTVTVGTNLAGYISDYRIYATALSASDVKSLYQNSAYIDSSGNIYGKIHD